MIALSVEVETLCTMPNPIQHNLAGDRWREKKKVQRGRG